MSQHKGCREYGCFPSKFHHFHYIYVYLKFHLTYSFLSPLKKGLQQKNEQLGHHDLFGVPGPQKITSTLNFPPLDLSSVLQLAGGAIAHRGLHLLFEHLCGLACTQRLRRQGGFKTVKPGRNFTGNFVLGLVVGRVTFFKFRITSMILG